MNANIIVHYYTFVLNFLFTLFNKLVFILFTKIKGSYYV